MHSGINWGYRWKLRVCLITMKLCIQKPREGNCPERYDPKLEPDANRTIFKGS